MNTETIEKMSGYRLPASIGKSRSLFKTLKSITPSLAAILPEKI
ncbi:hypothetical protein SAMN04515674_10581 [Pseudarcicella hirudinis]|uniref:Uncharacterized protein n=1 Tax=Pseudarcicella hirudinis TaxID=1079859 RepID=A0A1I5SMA7_9BACT|nr:hypothetical protein SAMN04515674_10581 [Pseudarcicella hirudinis]